LAPLVAIGLVVAACGDDSGEGEGITEDPSQFPRAETLYTGGAQWGTYTDFNPFTPSEVTYLRGFMYETLFEFDPWTAEVKPWLAEGGEWVEDNVYEVTLRDGITWHDGEPMTSDDVKFTFDQRDKDGVRFSELNEWLDEVEVVDELTTRFTFSEARYGQWDYTLYDVQIAPEHTWADKIGNLGAETGDDIVTGSGPFTYHSHEDTRLRYARYDDWWATDALGLEMPMKYVVDFNNESNEAAVAQITQNELDMSNFFLPNILELIEQNPEITTFYDSEPYMLSYNTASLIPNNTLAPLDDPALRRAMAFAINVQDIIENGYGNIVPAANPTGLLPLWVDAGLVDQQVVSEFGFSYDEAEANRLLDEAGYALDGDWRAQPDGEPIELTFTVQAGWTDWEIAADIIAENLQAVGLNVTVEAVEASELDALRRAGDYDIVMYNWTGRLTSHPFTNYVSLFELPLNDPQPGDNNVQRTENDRAWELTRELATLSLTDPATQDRLNEVLSELQEITLTEMPVIPMWNNGMWAQVNNTTWTNWPSEGGSSNYYLASWGGVNQMGTIRAFAELQPAG
jgi:peptide/nickel transport system substrate-binding protein